MALLEVQDVTVRFGGLAALDAVNLTVHPGEIVSIIGPNGAGTSILRWPSYKVARAGLIHIPEGRGILPSLTVRENIRVVLDSLGTGSDTNEVYALFPKLEERERQVAGTLSGGEQQMLAMALGLLARPKLMAIDEPSLGLAPILIQEVFRALEEVKRRGVSLLLVEQYVSLVMGLADVVYILDKGSVVFSGAPAELERSALADVYLGTHAVGADETQRYADTHLATAEVSFRLTARELRTLEKQARDQGRDVGDILHEGLGPLLERTR